MGINFIKYRKFYYIFSGILIILSVVALIFWGLKPGIEFTGGSIMELEYKDQRPSNEQIIEKIKDLDLGDISIQPTGENGVIVRMKDISEEIHKEIISALSQEVTLVPKEGGKPDEMEMKINMIEIEEKRFEAIGPVIGQELKQKTAWAATLSLIAMIAYIAFAFRRVTRPVSSWMYGIISFIALCHDIIIPLGVFAVLGRFYGIEITIPVITALLAVLGSSINNTVVVFDRIRENLLKRGETFEDTANNGMNQTLSRQINTSLAILFTVAAIYFFGGATLKYFSLALILGVLSGTYSSFFIASPLLVTWQRYRQKRI
ncbi:MAG: protein translocase subunit SecF [bacterium]|nr:protein translocase subunit SecF [bacterium]